MLEIFSSVTYSNDVMLGEGDREPEDQNRRLSWESLQGELDHLKTGQNHTLIPLLAGLSALMGNETIAYHCIRRLSYMGHELVHQTGNLGEFERFRILNEWYFDRWGFRSHRVHGGFATENDLLLDRVVADRRGHQLLTMLVYCHLGEKLGLKLQIVQPDDFVVVKWTRDSGSSLIDLEDEGRVLTEDRMVELCNRITQKEGAPQSTCFEILTGQTLFRLYLRHLAQLYEREQKWLNLRSCLNVALHLEPNDLRLLHRRAMLSRELGFESEALADLKRYHSFASH